MHGRCLILLMLSATAATAQPEPSDADRALSTDLSLNASDLEPERAWRFRGALASHDNDGSFIEPFDDDDRHYTSGSKIDLVFEPGFDADTRAFLAPADKWPDAKLAFGVVIAQHIYTASDIEIANPDPDDRPYAGYLYAGVYFQRATDHVHDHFELDVGVVGSWSFAEDAQRFVHGLPNQVEPRGWSTQLANELAINFRYQRSWKTGVGEWAGLEFDAIPRLGFDLGNVFIRGNTDVTVRMGKHLPTDFGPGRLLDYRDATGAWTHGWGAYLYARAGARAVGRNIFLDGNTFAESRSTDPERIVGEFELGLRAALHVWGGDLELGYGWTVYTNEYRAQTESDTVGALTVGWIKRF
ncbi:MAG: lipid A deacylase LpxR family protein [Phycisphaerales bacterium]